MHYHEFTKLRSGDIVVCNEDAYQQFTKGKYYEVSYINDCGPGHSNNSIYVVCDDAGNKNGWTIEHFDLLPANTLVWTAPSRGLTTGPQEPVLEPETKPNRSDAIWELLKMAAKQ